MTISFEPIGIIHTPFQSKEGMPIQSKGAKGVKAEVVVNDEFAEGLADLEGFSHIILIYHFHQSEGFRLKVKPFLDNNERGVFSTRAPKRPNAIGFSVVRLLRVEKNRLYIENADMLDGTPLLDIKPYVPAFDVYEVEKSGWTENKTGSLSKRKSDNRFE